MRSLKKISMALLCLVWSSFIYSQQLRLGKTSLALQKSAILELESNDQGMLFPRITDTTLINGLAPPDGMVIFHQPSVQLMIRSNGYWRALSTTDLLKNYWSITGNAGTSSSNFIGTTDDKAMIIKSNSNSFLELGRRATLGLVQAYTDYSDNNEQLTYLKSALQFYAPAAQFYKPKIFIDANGNFRIKGSAAGVDYFEFGATGTSDNGGLEFITGKDGNEPFVFKSYKSATSTMTEIMRLQSGTVGIGTASPAAVLDVAGTYKMGAKGTVQKNTISLEIATTSTINFGGANLVVIGLAYSPALVDVDLAIPTANAPTSTRATVTVSLDTDLPAGVSIGSARLTSTSNVRVRMYNASTNSRTLGNGTKFYVTITEF
ncbi:MAG: hypothetical protein E6Q24_13135 [Chitinophagaceae bacterium]|jgi:hypothetical protein|nr:MAG: hypothetical protein E6Q24_13135 [Chitinophagaceae bacterium]